MPVNLKDPDEILLHKNKLWLAFVKDQFPKLEEGRAKRLARNLLHEEMSSLFEHRDEEFMRIISLEISDEEFLELVP